MSAIALIFWVEEWKYAQPTPKPLTLREVHQGDVVRLPERIQSEKPVFLHFYNYECPCSRFNIKEFESLVYRFGKDISFFAVLQTDDHPRAIEQFKRKYDLGIPIIEDPEGKLASALGVYSTPQAVIIDKGKIYFKGNYNKARFCTTRNTKFAEIALKALLAGEEAPVFPEIALISYGCELPSNNTTERKLLSIF